MTFGKVHLVTQRDQPYGSTRLCCEKCGAMVRDDPGHLFTSGDNNYRAHWMFKVTEEGVRHYWPCDRTPPEDFQCPSGTSPTRHLRVVRAP